MLTKPGFKLLQPKLNPLTKQHLAASVTDAILVELIDWLAFYSAPIRHTIELAYRWPFIDRLLSVYWETNEIFFRCRLNFDRYLCIDESILQLANFLADVL